MRRSMWLHFILVLVFFFSPFKTIAAVQPNAEVDKETRARVSQSYGKLPLRFEVNEGQYDDQVSYLSRGAGYSLFLTPTEAVMVLSRTKVKQQTETNTDLSSVEPKVKEYESSTLRMQLVDANPMPLIIPEEKQQGKTNYLKGNDPEQWRTNVTNYSKIKYRQVYPGIDLVYYGNQQKLEYDFIVSPGVNYKTIQMRFTGAEKIDLDEAGNLVLSTPTGDVFQKAPIIYQMVDGERKLIDGKYVLWEENRVGFQVAQYDQEKSLIIDPVLEYSTYLGGSNDDAGSEIAVDNVGNIYVTGFTRSTNFPTANPIQGIFGGGNPAIGADTDAFVSKISINISGSALVYSTYLGGNDRDTGLGISVDDSGNAYVVGDTNSTNFPTVNAIQSTYGGGGFVFGDAFVSKLNSTGTALVYSTYLGGNDDERGSGITIDGSGNAYVAGSTQSTNFPTFNPIQGTFAGSEDAFVTKINSAGTLIYSTYLGGSGTDSGNDIDVDGSGNVYITGSTSSSNFPTVNPIQPTNGGGGGFIVFGSDAFVTKINSGGTALVYSTYLGGSSIPIGGSNNDTGFGIAVDSAGNAYVTGLTNSANFPITANAFQGTYGGGPPFVGGDAFVSKINSAGTVLDYSTFLGGGGFDQGLGISVDSLSNAYITGVSSQSNIPPFPLTATAIQGLERGVFLTKMNVAGSVLIHSTFLGSGNGSGIALDNTGNAYITGRTNSSSFPVTGNAIQTTSGGGDDAFVNKVNIPQITNPARNDFDGDGDSDLLLVHDTGLLVSVLLENSIFQGFSFILQADPLQGWSVPATADFNGDGKADILLVNSTTGDYRVVLMDGLNIISDTVVLVLNPVFGLEPRGVGDFDGDGLAEIIVFQPTNGSTGLVYLSGGGVFDRFEIITTIDVANNVTLKDTGDFNQDGKTDLMTYNTVTGEAKIITMDDNISAAPASIFTLPPATGFTLEDTGDFNGDGKTDVLAIQSLSGALIVLLMDELTFTSAYVPGNLPAGFELVNGGTYDGDTKADFLVYSDSSGELITFIQDGALVTSVNTVLNLGPASGWTYHKGKP